MKKNLSILFVLLFTGLGTFAQKNGEWCGTDQKFNEMLKSNPELLEQWNQQLEQIRQKQEEFLYQYEYNPQKESVVKIIPVVVHIIHDNWSGDISDAQVEDGIAVLNEDFRRLNSDTGQTRSVFKPYAADSEFEFRLAKIDPNGNCTKGIVRVNSPLTNNANDNVKSLSYWPSNKYFNVWLVKSIENNSGQGTILGYAQFPGFGSWNTYGVVVRNDQWGRIGSSFSDGRTATHEVGHCLGLFHTFQGGCGSNCSNSGDQVCDTPPTANATYGCSTTQNTCSNDASGPSPYSTDVPDQIENYMSYDACQNMFTLGQKARMQAVINNYSQLQQLTSSSNLVATGTNDGYVAQTCAPIADFTWNREMICQGSSVSFTDKSWNGTPTSWNWTFQGGTPSSSTLQNPTVVYNTPGIYSVSLTASNSAGSNSKTINNLIYVSSTTAQHNTWPLVEDFEDGNQFNNEWIIVNQSGAKWERVNTAAYSGSFSMRLNNNGQTAGTIDEAISPSYNIALVGSGAKLRFKVAYAQKNSGTNDNLRIYYTTNCGQSWTIKYAKVGGNLATVSPTSNNFVPSGPNDWKEEVVDLTGLTNSTNVRFKFWFMSDGGNNIYIDDINIDKANDIEESSVDPYLVNVFPVPATNQLSLQFNLVAPENIGVAIYDLSGRLIQTVVQNLEMPAGLHTIDLHEFANNHPKGIYTLKLSGQRQSVVKKIILQ